MWNRAYSDRSDIDFTMKPSELQNLISVGIYDVKIAENYRNCYVVEKR